MNPTTDRTQSGQTPTESPPIKRFRIVKLEERIAPGNGGHGNGSNATCGNIATCHNGCSSTSGSIF